MSHPRLYTARALVIKQRRNKEHDEAVTLLTDALGKITVRARGSKKIRSRFLGHLDLGNICAVTLARGAHDRYVLTNCRVMHPFLALKKTRQGLDLILFAMTVLDRTLWEGQGNHLLERICLLLTHADQKKAPENTIKHAFVRLGLQELGLSETTHSS